MKKIIILMLMLVLIPTIVEAREYLYYKHGETIELRRECINDGNLCDGDFNCTITIYQSNGTVIVDNSEMSNQTSYYNYTLGSGSDFKNGEYRSRWTCTDGTDSGSEIFYFRITPSGDDRGNNIFLILGIASFLFMGLAIYYKDDTLGFIAGALFLVTGVYVMVYGVTNLANLYTQAMAYVAIGLGLLFIINSAYSSLTMNST